MRQAVEDKEHARGTFRLIVRLGVPEQEPHSGEGVLLRVRAQSLVEDLLASRLNANLVEGERGYLYAAGAAECGKALAACRALQVAFEAFRKLADRSAGATLSMLLDTGGENPGALIENEAGHAEGLAGALELARPSQVLITEGTYQELLPRHKFRVKSFPAQPGVYEFLWATEERMQAAQRDGRWPLPAPRVGAPGMVRDEREELRLQPRAIVEPRNAEAGLFAAQRRQWAERLSRMSASQRRWTVVMFALVIVMAATGLVLARADHQPAKPKVAAAAAAAPGAQTGATPPVASPAPAAPAPAAPAPLVAPDRGVQPSTVAAASRGSKAAVVPPAKRTDASGAGADRPARDRTSACAIDGEIPEYMALAERNGAKGQYGAAAREYGQVLACEPGNRAARQGLQRVLDAQQLNAEKP